VRVHIVDPSAFTPPYDHALSAALARAGADVTLVTSHFAYGPVPRQDGYALAERFYRRAVGPPGSKRRLAAKLVQHVPDMLAYRRSVTADRVDVVHFQWLTIQHLDAALLPRDRPVVITAHDVLPREPRPGQRAAQRRLYHHADAIVVHSQHGRRRLIAEVGVEPEKVNVIPHGAFTHLVDQPDPVPLPEELRAVDKPVVLCFGLIRPYKGVDVLLEAWAGIDDAELWIVGMPRVPLEPLRQAAPPGVRFVPRFVTDPEIPAFFDRADLVVLPYREIDQSGVLATALAFGSPLLMTSVGGFPEVSATGAGTLVAPGDPDGLRAELRRLLADPAERERLGRAAAAAAAGPFAWDTVARAHLDLYERLTGGDAREET
jgi:glycosyltransferase involved in cell wall biosynthesis